MDCRIDVVFVVDASESIYSSNFERVKSFLSRVVSRLDIDSDKTRVGLVTFSTRVGTTINLNAHSTVASLQSAISSLSYSRGSTYTNAALEYVRTEMLTSAAGDRSNVRNVVVVVTDGRSDDKAATQVSSMQSDVQVVTHKNLCIATFTRRCQIVEFLFFFYYSFIADRQNRNKTKSDGIT